MQESFHSVRALGFSRPDCEISRILISDIWRHPVTTITTTATNACAYVSFFSLFMFIMFHIAAQRHLCK
jgi:hypothetical protein